MKKCDLCISVLCRSRRELSNKYLHVFTCKNRLRYSRERALQSFKFHSHLANLVLHCNPTACTAASAFNSHPVRAKQKFRVLNYHAFAKQIGPRKRDMTFSVPSKMHTGALGSRLPHLCEVSPTCEKRSLQPSSAHRAIPHGGRLKPAVNGSCFK